MLEGLGVRLVKPQVVCNWFDSRGNHLFQKWVFRACTLTHCMYSSVHYGMFDCLWCMLKLLIVPLTISDFTGTNLLAWFPGSIQLFVRIASDEKLDESLGPKLQISYRSVS